MPAGPATAAVATQPPPCPQVWQDLLVATRSAQSTEYLDSLACRPPSDLAHSSPSHASTSTARGMRGASSSQEAGAEGSSVGSTEGASDGTQTSRRGDASLGITTDTVFSQFLSPEALVCRHRLGKPEVRRLYRALQARRRGQGRRGHSCCLWHPCLPACLPACPPACLLPDACCYVQCVWPCCCTCHYRPFLI